MLWRIAVAAAGGMGVIAVATASGFGGPAAPSPAVSVTPPAALAPAAPSGGAATQANLSVSVPYTPPRSTIAGYCRELLSGRDPAPSYSFTSFVSETGGSAGSTEVWCRNFLTLPNVG